MNLATIESEFATIEPALLTLENVAQSFSVFLPPSVAAALVTLRAFQAAAPALLEDIGKVVGDFETAYATVTAPKE